MATKKLKMLIFFLGSFFINFIVWADDKNGPVDLSNGSNSTHSNSSNTEENKVKMVYPKKTELQFDGTQIEGEIKNPGEFYFQHRPEEKFDSLIQRRKNFHREMLRDVVLGK